MRALLLAALAALPAFAEEAGRTGLDDAQVQRVHVVERRPFTEAGRWEISVFAPVQVNPKFTVHAGVTAEVAYHLRENLAAQLGVIWFPIARQSGLSEELTAKANEVPQTASAFLLQGAALLGFELMPVYGKLNVFDGKILRLGFYLNASLGVAKTRLQLLPSTSEFGRQYGDTGFRPMGSLGAGFRVFVSERFTVRIEVRDLAYSGYASKVNGCTVEDTDLIRRFADGAYPAGTAPGAGCDVSAFGKYDPASPESKRLIQATASGAWSLLGNPSADVINNVVFQGGVSWLF